MLGDALTNTCKTKPDIDYPCTWPFKVIGSSKSELEKAIGEVVGKREALVSFSRSSSGGKFVSLNLELIVENEEDRNSIYVQLNKHRAVKMVI